MMMELISGTKFKGNYETETDNIMFDLNILNIENYEKKKLVFNPNKRYIGFSPKSFNNLNSPTIIYENASNDSLSRLLELEKKK